MADQDPDCGEQPEESTAFAPKDYTDGRSIGDWETRYPKKAQTEITYEGIYVTAVFLIYSALVFVGIYLSSIGSLPPDSGVLNSAESNSKLSPSNFNGWLPAAFLGYCCAWVGGGVGGSLFGLKWMYHSVAKRIWHQDRRLWRILTPHISAALATFMLLVISSGFVSVFDKNIAVRHIDILAFSFLVGLFSDKALAKLSEVADTLFGPGKSISKRSDADSRHPE